jgi:acyl-[acyl carrier protein]--UDP-N-acetylglucosamine O-acyltransferase
MMSILSLSALGRSAGLSVVRDASVAQCGFADAPLPDTLGAAGAQKFLDVALTNPNVTAIVVTRDLADQVPEALGLAIADDPMEAMFRVHLELVQRRGAALRSQPTELGDGCQVHPAAYIEDFGVRLGDGCIVGPGAMVLAGSILGSEVVLGPRTVVGTEGFEVRKIDGRARTVPHLGGVRLGDRVEVTGCGAFSKALFGAYTEVGDDCKFDNFVHIAHGVRVGARCKFAAQAMVAGSVTIGDDVWIGPTAAISSGVRIGDKAFVTIGAVVTRDVPPLGHVSGNFAIDHTRFMAHVKAIR